MAHPGDASGQVVYANYGRPDDFAALEKLGIDVKDKIVLVRYGEIFRGLKVYNAQKRGAKGILIFSDPADDGYAKGDVYPARADSAPNRRSSAGASSSSRTGRAIPRRRSARRSRVRNGSRSTRRISRWTFPFGPAVVQPERSGRSRRA